jgi:hypothetical protein
VINMFIQKVRAAHRDIKNTELPAKRQQIAMINNYRETSYRQFYCEIMYTMKGKLINRYPKLSD